MKSIKCPKCNGTGRIPNQRSIGMEFRRLRTQSGLSLRQVARSMSISAMHLSDLERGNRTWKDAHKLKFMDALGGR